MGISLPYIDPKASQWNAEREAKINASYAEFRAYPPTVKVEEGIFPPQDELQNCTTCSRGKKLPQEDITTREYHRHCTWDIKTHIGQSLFDNDCGYYMRKKSD